MAKDAFWFKHDSNAGRDIKLLKLKGIYTHWATGIYWEVNEMLREQDGYKFNSDESSLQILCSMIGCNDFPKFKNWFNDAVKVGLYVDRDGVFYSESMVHRMKKWESTKENGRRGGLTKAENELGSESDSEIVSEQSAQNLPLRREEMRGEKRRGEREEEIFDACVVWLDQIASESDPTYEKMLYKAGMKWNSAAVDWYKGLLATYPNMKPTTQQKLRYSFLERQKEYESGRKNGKIPEAQDTKGMRHFDRPKEQI